MTCAASLTGVTTTNWESENWAGTQRLLIPTMFNPDVVGQIVAGVQETERVGGRLKAIGSRFAYGEVALDASTTHVMNTELLKRELSTPGTDAGVIPFALRRDLPLELFVHVEAGIKVHALNRALDNRGLAMPTLGGSNGQSIAGAISTGTHGGDVAQPPIADAVAAIHLVGPGGQEWWIERGVGDGSITDPARMEKCVDKQLCKDILIKRDTTLFRAVLVSMGRMGVIYSYVLRAVPAYRLTETRSKSSWSTEAAFLRVSTDPYRGRRFMEIVLNPYPDGAGDHACVVTSRELASDATLDTPDPVDDVPTQITKWFCTSSHINAVLIALLATLPVAIATATATATTALAALLLIPFVGPILFAVASTTAIASATAALVTLEYELTRLLALSPGGNFADQLANVLNRAVQAGQKQIVPLIIGNQTATLRPEGVTTGKSYRIMTQQKDIPEIPEPHSLCERHVDGLEFAFDMTAGKQNLFQFIDEVFTFTDARYAAGRPAGFGISLRFTGMTEALMGMQQFERTCAVEFFFLRGVAGLDSFVAEIIAISKRHGAIPHWGQLHELTAQEVRDLYPQSSEWRQALQLIIEGHGRPGTFRSNFSLARGLEPEAIQPPHLSADGHGGEADPYDFGTLALHERRTVMFHFTNPVTTLLSVAGLSADGDFRTTDVPDPRNLELSAQRPSAKQGEEIEVVATFIGVKAGRHAGVLRIQTSATGLPSRAITIPIHALVESFAVTLVDPVPGSVLDLGASAIDQTHVVPIRVRNDGSLGVRLEEYTHSNPAAESQIGVETDGIAAGQTRDFNVSVRLSSVGQLATDIALLFTDGLQPVRHSTVITVPVVATGLGAQAELTPAELDFGTVPVGAQSAPQIVELKNVGQHQLNLTSVLLASDFKLLGTAPTHVGAGQTEPLSVVFRPGKGGFLSSALSVSSDSVQPPTPVSAHGIGVVAPVVVAEPALVGFGATPLGSRSAEAVVVLRNDGAVTVRLDTVVMGGADNTEFRLIGSTHTGTELWPEDTCEVRVAFTPHVAGPKQAFLAVDFTPSTGTLQVPLAGEAIAALGLVPDASALDFGAVPVGSASGARQVVLTNAAASPATIAAIAVDSDFEITADGCTGKVLTPGTSCAIRVAAKPTARGPRSGELYVKSDVPASPVSLRASGLGLDLEWSRALVDFGVLPVAEKSMRETVYIRNIGTATLVVKSIDVVGDFMFQDLMAGYDTIPPNGEKLFWVWFEATVVGTRNGTLRVHSTDASSPHTVPLTGVGSARP